MINGSCYSFVVCYSVISVVDWLYDVQHNGVFSGNKRSQKDTTNVTEIQGLVLEI